MKKLLKPFTKRCFALFACAFMLLSSFTFSAFAAPTPPTPDNADIVINGATAEDKFSAYKIIDITYDAKTNTLKNAWTTDVQAILSALKDTTTPEVFAALEESARQAFLSKVANYLVKGGTIASTTIPASTPAATATAGADGQVKFTSSKWGEYLIVPTLTTSVYQIMVGTIQPVGNGTSWTVTQGEALTAKKTDGPTIAKTATETDVGAWTIITYSVEFDIPKYGDQTKADAIIKLVDKADSALSYKENLKIYGIDAMETAELKTSDVTGGTTSIPAADTAGYKIALDFVYDQISKYNKIKVEYDAVINDTAALNADIPNSATLTYSNYPYVEDSRKDVTTEENVKTFGIKIFKYDVKSSTGKTYADVTKDTGAKPLPDAVFDLYRTVEAGETGIDVEGIKVKVIKAGTITSGTDGYAQIENIKSGTYYLVETAAPSGYNLLKAPIEMTFAGTDVDAEGFYDQLVANNSGFVLPQTGGMGTAIFTVAGIILMAGAVVLFTVLKKKKQNS